MLQIFHLVLILTVAFVKCDVSHLTGGYHYQPPTSYGVPLNSVMDLRNKQTFVSSDATLPSSGNQLPVHESQTFTQDYFNNQVQPDIDLRQHTGNVNSNNNYHTAPAGNTFGASDSSFTSGNSFATSGGASSISSPIPPIGGNNYETSAGHDFISSSQGSTRNNFGSGNNYQSSGVTNTHFDSNYQTSQQDTQISKHLYFFAAPEEPEEPKSRTQIPIAPPKKNVKIIFIKAPSYAAPAPIQIPLQPQNEEKTLVYVLVKKPEEAGPIEIPNAPSTPPTKPEVYFIKYKTQKEAEEAISQVQSGGHVSGGASISANSLDSDQAFISHVGQSSGGSQTSVNYVNTGSSVDGNTGSTGNDNTFATSYHGNSGNVGGDSTTTYTSSSHGNTGFIGGSDSFTSSNGNLGGSDSTFSSSTGNSGGSFVGGNSGTATYTSSSGSEPIGHEHRLYGVPKPTK